LVKNDEIEILVAYEIDKGLDALNAITAMRNVSDEIQDFYENNFDYPIVLSTEDQINNPIEYSLSQNYPNPFNPTTKIKYGFPEEGFVNLSVYDLLGNEVAVLKNEEQNAGKFEIDFNTSNLASGVYFYILRVNNFMQTRKMLLLK